MILPLYPGYKLTGNYCSNCGNPLSKKTEREVDGEYYCSLCDPRDYT